MPAGLGLGVRLLAFSPLRLLLAIGGIAMAVTIMFVELGLLLSVLDSQARIAAQVRGDLVVMHRARSNLQRWTEIPETRLAQIAAHPDVDRVAPIFGGVGVMRNPRERQVRRTMIFGLPIDDPPLAIGDPGEIGRLLRISGTVLFDRQSRPIYGDIKPGDEVELDGGRFRVGGFVDIGPTIINDGAFVMSTGAWRTLYGDSDPVMGAIRLKAGADRERVRASLLAMLPHDALIMTPQEVHQREVDFTLRSAPIGVLFGIGMLAGMVIGSITCYQVLYSEVSERLKQFATLMAMGFSRHFLRRIILEQALLLSVIGFAAGLAFGSIALDILARETALATRLTGERIGFVLGLTLLMCVVAGLLAIRRVEHADPAALY
jgi:putative ABC transport system permease protein